MARSCIVLGTARAGVAAILLAGLLPALAENLLANPGFEELAADRPVRWDHFVQPKPGAVAELTDQAHGGQYAVWLHTPTPYEKEPVNNWSQNIIADLGGATLRVSGFIRVEDAKEAALWLQSWRKKPWGVMGAESTSIDMPVYGSHDWQEVSMTVDVPEGADFVTLRCVLLGAGSAWFDDLSVTRTTDMPAEPAEPAAPAEAKTAKANQASRPAAPAVETEAAELEAVAGSPAAAKGAASQDAVLPMVNQLESEVRRLRDANAILTGTLEDIQSVNQALLTEMLSVQAELQALRAEKEGAQAPPLEPSRPHAPPLIPLSQAHEVGAP